MTAPTPDDVIDHVCSTFAMDRSTLFSSQRAHKHAPFIATNARWICWFVMKHSLGTSHKEIAAIFKRNRSTVTHAICTVEARCRAEPTLDILVKQISFGVALPNPFPAPRCRHEDKKALAKRAKPRRSKRSVTRDDAFAAAMNGAEFEPAGKIDKARIWWKH